MITDAKKQTRHRTEVLRLAGILILLSHAVNTVSILFCNLTLHRDRSTDSSKEPLRLKLLTEPHQHRR